MTPTTALPRWLSGTTLAMALITFGIGFWQTVLPLNFYQAFPGLGHQWVTLLPPYNEHLVRDVGEGNIAFGLLFGWGALTHDSRVLRPTSVAWIVAATLHFLYHLLNLSAFTPGDQVLQMGALGIIIVIPVSILLGLRQQAIALTR
jgi:hypothetical protein